MNFDTLTKIYFGTKKEATDILNEMKRVCDCYGFATIADMYDLAAKNCSYVANKYGWVDLSKVEVVKEDGGYTINLPKPIPIA